jgi:hypothetical protein
MNNLTQDSMLQIISLIISGVTSIAGVVIAVMLYKLSKQQQREAWIRTFIESHEAFWNDSDMVHVRSRLACEQGYQFIKPILLKRKDISDNKLSPEALAESEYVELEKLDKFLNLLLRINAVNTQAKFNPKQDQMWNRLFFTSWFVKMFGSDRRTELRWYVESFFPEFKPRLRENEKHTQPLINDAT